MRKEDLKKLGLDDVTASKVAEASAEEFKNYVALSRFNEINESNKMLKEKLDELEHRTEDFNGHQQNMEVLQAELLALKENNMKMKTDYDAGLMKLKVEHTVEKALMTAGARNMKAAKALLQLDQVKVEEDGIKGLEEQIEELKVSDTSSFLFEQPKEETHVPTFKGMTPKESTNGFGGMKPLSQMTYSQMVAYGQNQNY